MDPRLLETAIVAVSVAAWFGAYGVALLITRPLPVRAGPATPDLPPEPPAVASMFANGWDVTEDAVEATLLDLAARRHLELRQPDDDARHTTIHVTDPRPVGLSRYEQRVFDRVAGLAVGGVVPLTALTFRDEKKAKAWWKRVKAEIVADARLRGLSRRRFSRTVVGILIGLAVPAAIGAVLAGVHYAQRSTDDDASGVPFSLGFLTFLVLAAVAGHSIGERDTPAGREVAARWLGVRDWLRGHEAFADLPPASVTVWDRYLGYGAALGTTRLTSAVIDMGMGDRKRVWSSFGGTWHRVRIRYPRMVGRIGRSMGQLAVRLLLCLGIGLVLLRYWRPLVDAIAEIDNVAPYAALARTVGTLVGILLVLYAIYVLVGAIIDLASPRTLTGQVLWQQVGESSSGSENSPPRPLLYYIAIDDGRGEKTTAWVLPVGLAHCMDGDTVSVRVRPWTRRILQLTTVERGTAAHHLTEPSEERTETLIAVAMGVAPAARTSVATRELLTAAEVGQALGRAVAPSNRLMPDVGVPVRMAEFRGPDGTTVLHVMEARGIPATLAMRARKNLAPLPGVGDEAFIGEGVAVARRGDAVVLLRPSGPVNPEALRYLLSQAVARLTP